MAAFWMNPIAAWIYDHALPQSMTASWIAVVVLVLLFLICFLLGSIPWGVIISRVFYKKDIREEGSGNIGATNAVRSMGARGGIAVFMLDLVKGLVAGCVGVVAGFFVATNFDIAFQNAYGIALLGCTLGHIFSPWLGWKGGKGITVAFGCSFFVFPGFGVLFILLVFLVVVAITRRISCGSIAGAIAEICVGSYFYWGHWMAVVCAVAVGVVVIWAHRANIKRLIAGTEPKIGSKKKGV